MLRATYGTMVIVAVLLVGVACGYGTSATFNSDGTVSLALKFLFPTSLMQGGSSGSVQGFSSADISKANTQLASKYPGAKITTVAEGEESGAEITIPFKTEKDAFAFMTTPSQLKPSGATSGSSSGVDLSNTGGLFASATHTTNGQADTYTFKSQPAPLSSPSPGSTSPLSADQLASIFTITFSLTVPHEITSAPGALFTLDRKTAIWKLSMTQSQTVTATTGPSVGLVGLVANGAQGQGPAIVIGVALVGIVVGFILGTFLPWRRLRSSPMPVTGPALEPPGFASPGAPPTMEPPSTGLQGAWQGPPPGMPPPPMPPGS